VLQGKKIGVAMTGSHCTLEEIFKELINIKKAGADIYPIVSPAVHNTDTRFGTAAQVCRHIEEITGRKPWKSIVEAEPIGPKKILDLLLIAPCTGNTMAKLANGIVDSAVLMAAKAQLRNGRPVVLSIATNDALGLNARNLATLLNTKNIYMVPFMQDNPWEKPNSLISRAELIVPTIVEALQGRQLQPVLYLAAGQENTGKR